jgi:hypothetical protein
MTQSEIRELAENHWKYTEGLLKASGITPTEREHYEYVESGIHFYKHGYNDALKRKNNK